MTKHNALSKCFLFSDTDESFRKRIIDDERTGWLNVDAGERIFSENSGAEPVLCIIAAGTLSVFREHGETRVLLNEIKAPGLVGAASLFGKNETYSTTVMAKKRCQVLLLKQSLIEELIRENGDFALKYIGFLSDRIRFLNGRIASFTSGSAAERLAQYLLTHNIDGKCNVNRMKLAAELDIGRASLYRAIDTLINDGLIEAEGKVFVITDKKALSDYIKQL